MDHNFYTNSIEIIKKTTTFVTRSFIVIFQFVIKEALQKCEAFLYYDEIITTFAKKHTMLDKILDWFPEDEILRADGFDDAIIGIDDATMRLIYSESKCIKILMKDMDEEDAVEYFNFNVKSAYVGEKNPIWCLDTL